MGTIDFMRLCGYSMGEPPTIKTRNLAYVSTREKKQYNPVRTYPEQSSIIFKKQNINEDSNNPQLAATL